MNSLEAFSRINEQVYASPAYKRTGSSLWLFLLKITKLTFPKRGKLLISVHAVTRMLDDIADGDINPPLGHTRVSYLKEKKAFLHKQKNPKDDLDFYILHCLSLVRSLGFEIKKGLGTFFNYFIFDTLRLGTSRIFSKITFEKV